MDVVIIKIARHSRLDPDLPGILLFMDIVMTPCEIQVDALNTNQQCIPIGMLFEIP